MKATGRDLEKLLRASSGPVAAYLLYGPDPARIAAARKKLVLALLGEDQAQMGLKQLAAADIAKDPALLDDALRASSFFGDRQVVLVENAGDILAKHIAPTLAGETGETKLILTAGKLSPSGGLRKLFEPAAALVSVAFYADPLSRAEIGQKLTEKGVKQTSPDLLEALEPLANSMDYGSFDQFVEKLALYCNGRMPTLEDIHESAPLTRDAAIDAAIGEIANGNRAGLAMTLSRLADQGVRPATLTIATTRHFRLLHEAANSSAPAQTLASARPPVFGPQRDQMVRQAQKWGSARIEAALGQLLAADLKLRSSSAAPDQALAERTLVRICMMCPTSNHRTS